MRYMLLLAILLPAPALGQQIEVYKDNLTGVVSPEELQEFRSSFDVSPSGAALPVDAESDYQIGGSIFFQQDEASGLNLLQSSAASGNADAATALGIALDSQGNAEAAYHWFQEGAKAGNPAAALLQGRSELYGVGTTQDFDAAFDSLTTAYEAGEVEAARDLAKAVAYNWTNSLALDAKGLWTDALESGDATTLLEYGRYLSAGGSRMPPPELLPMLVSPALASDAEWGAVASWDFARDFAMEPIPEVIQELERAHMSGNIDATARLGEWLVSSSTPEEQKLGIDYLSAAASEGKAIAFTALGSYYLNNPEETTTPSDAVDNLLTGLRLGDVDASVALADYHRGRSEFGLSFDYSVLAATGGTARAKSLARANVTELCTQLLAACKKVPVAFVTTREHRSVAGQLEFLSIPRSGFAETFGFAEVLVPTVDAPEATDFNLLALLGNLVNTMLGASSRQDTIEDSLTRVTVIDEWGDFADALSELTAAEGAGGGSGEALLFVHGVNTSFEGAILAAARLKMKGNLPGIPVVYSWPAGDMLRKSNGILPSIGYTTDVNTASRNCSAFQDFLVRFTQRFGSDRTTLIAHSHGSEMVMSGLTACRGARPGEERVEPYLKHIIYAAPDVDRDEFVEISPQIADVASGVTLYASDADLALYLSGEILSSNPRAGMGGARRVVVPGVDTIDLSNISFATGSTDGHGYLWTANAVLDDLREIIRHSSPPSERCLESREAASGGNYWQFRRECALQ